MKNDIILDHQVCLSHKGPSAHFAQIQARIHRGYGKFTFFCIRRGIFFSNPWLSRIIWSNFERNTSLQKKMTAFFLHAPFWLLSLVTMFFCSFISNPVRFTVVPVWTDFNYLATIQTFSSENSQTLKCCHFLKSKGYKF